MDFLIAPASLEFPPTALTNDARRPSRPKNSAIAVSVQSWRGLKYYCTPEEDYTSRSPEKVTLIGRIYSVVYDSRSTPQLSQVAVFTNIQAQRRWAASLQY